MIPELGLICITASECVRYRTITRTRLLQFPEEEQASALRTLYAENLRRLGVALDFCAAQNIRLYRMSSATFPFSDSAIGQPILEEFADTLAALGQQARDGGLRLTLHPEQFVVLNSDRPEVIANSITILTAHARMLDLIGMPRSAWTPMNIHGGKGGQADRLVEVIGGLPDNIRLRLTLENDEHAYGAADILAVCRAAKVPMVFDAHHHVVRENLESYEDPGVAEFLAAAKETWDPPEWQMVHISNGLEAFTDHRHHDFITCMPSAFRDAPWIDVEAKGKEDAITYLRRWWVEGVPQDALPLPITASAVSNPADSTETAGTRRNRRSRPRTVAD